jgi:putative transposase
MVLLARCFGWREALAIVQPATLLRWHRQAFRLLWRWRSRSGRPRLPAELQRLIAAMARDNPSWGEERIAAELLLKLGLRVSPRTVRQYMARGTGGGGRGAGQRWGTFVRNHAQAVLACDFCVAVTATFQVLQIFVALEVGSRRLVRVRAGDAADWAGRRRAPAQMLYGRGSRPDPWYSLGDAPEHDLPARDPCREERTVRPVSAA